MRIRRRAFGRFGAASASLIAVAALAATDIGAAHAAPANDATCRTALNGTPVGAAGQAANAYVLNVGEANSFGTVYQPAANTQAAFPNLAAADTVKADGTLARRLTARFSEAPDTTTAVPKNGQVISNDGGATFGSYTAAQAPGVGFSRLRDGTLLGYRYVPTTNSSGTDYYTAFRSTDEGASWVSEQTPFALGSGTNAGSRLQGAPLELPDGTILMGLYSNGAGRSQVEASTDGGHSFTRRAILGDGNSTTGYNEVSIAQLPSGKLVAVMRHHVSGALATPAQVTSTDNGATWTAPAALSVSFPHGYDPYDDNTKTLLGVAPDLKLMPNGVLVLRSGRPDNWVAISSNGQGTGWVGQLTYRNCPSDGVRTHGSTGYGGIDYLGANRAIVIGDNCEMTWGCVTAGETDFTIDKRTRVWRRWIDVLTPDVGRIDLATKYRRGAITVSGNMTDAVAGHPRARVDGAFDGSTEYWSSAVHAGGPGSFILNLDRTYPLTKIGLSLRNGRPASGRVYASTDGTTWGDPVATVANRTDLAMGYFTFAGPVQAKYLKVELDASTNCDAVLGGSCAFLNELELYSLIDSFENDPVNNRPRGFTGIVSSWISKGTSDLAGHDSERALRIMDSTDEAQAAVTWPGTATATKTLEFRLKPTTLVGFLFDLLGTNSGGTAITAYHFAVANDGSIRRHNGTAWVTLTAAGTITQDTWYTIRITATKTAATIAVNGRTVASGIPVTTAASTLTGYKMASNGTPSTGDNYVVDDIVFTS